MAHSRNLLVAVGPARRGRDARVDFFRGLALLFIFVDHIANNFLESFTFQNFGFADAADVFVVLAGYASCLAYTKVFVGQGWGAGLARVGRRIRALYLSHIVVLIVCVGGLAIAAQRFENPIFDELVDLSPFIDDPAGAFRRALMLVHQPAYLDILPLYIVLLIWFPVLLWLVRFHVALAFAASAMLWMAANFLDWNFPSFPDNEGWFFNPFAWQLLFSLGAITAYLTSKGNLPPRPGWLLWVATGFVLFAIVVAAPWTALPGLEKVRLLPTELLLSPDSKQNLSLWRVAHIAALAYIAASLIPARASWLANPWARRVIDCGRHSLPVFCLGIVLSLGASVVVAELGSGWVSQISVNALGIALLAFTGWAFAEMKRAKTPRAEDLVAEIPVSRSRPTASAP